MISFARTFDFALVRDVMTHPRLWQADDFTPPRETWRPREDPGIWYVRVDDDAEQLLGLFIFAPQNAVCWEIHTRLLPASWGARAAAAGQGITPWAWVNIPHCRRIVTSVPADNRLAIRFAERSGFARYGVNPASYQLRGALHDQVLLGISFPIN